jgi:hypothetical protein
MKRKRKKPHVKLGKMCVMCKYFNGDTVTVITYSLQTENILLNKKWFYLF